MSWVGEKTTQAVKRIFLQPLPWGPRSSCFRTQPDVARKPKRWHQQSLWHLGGLPNGLLWCQRWRETSGAVLESCREYKGYIYICMRLVCSNVNVNLCKFVIFVGVWIIPFTHVAFTQHLTGSPYWNKIFFALLVDWNLWKARNTHPHTEILVRTD